MRSTRRTCRPGIGETPVVIFDCNGVLVDSEPIAAAVAAQEFTPRRYSADSRDCRPLFHRPAARLTCLPTIETATQRKLPADFVATVVSRDLRRLRAELRADARTPHYALTWLRGPKCVASSSTLDRIRDEPRNHRPDPLLRAASVFGERRAQRQAGARSIPACGRNDARSSRPNASWSRILRAGVAAATRLPA